jgi:serine/threonine-protein kinase RsbW
MSQYRLSFPSTIDHCRELRQWIGVISHIEGYSEDFTFSLELTVHEIYINAVRHGNQNDAQLGVVVTFETAIGERERSLEVRVRDCGGGFDPEHTIASICSSRSGVSSGGRGLYITTQLVKSFRIEKQPDGCVVVMYYIPPC